MAWFFHCSMQSLSLGTYVDPSKYFVPRKSHSFLFYFIFSTIDVLQPCTRTRPPDIVVQGCGAFFSIFSSVGTTRGQWIISELFFCCHIFLTLSFFFEHFWSKHTPFRPDLFLQSSRISVDLLSYESKLTDKWTNKCKTTGWWKFFGRVHN